MPTIPSAANPAASGATRPPQPPPGLIPTNHSLNAHRGSTGRVGGC